MRLQEGFLVMDTHFVSVQQGAGTTGISSSRWFLRAGTTLLPLALLSPPPSVENEDFPLPSSKAEEKFRLLIREGRSTHLCAQRRRKSK